MSSIEGEMIYLTFLSSFGRVYVMRYKYKNFWPNRIYKNKKKLQITNYKSVEDMRVFLHIKRDLCETSVLPYLQASTTVSVILTMLSVGDFVHGQFHLHEISLKFTCSKCTVTHTILIQWCFVYSIYIKYFVSQ